MNLILPCEPGCCGGDSCQIAYDDFNRPDEDDINDGAPVTWTGDNENIVILNNGLFFFSAAAEALTCGTSHPDSVKSGTVKCTFTGFANGEEVEVFLNATDSSNCTVARLTLGPSGTLEIFDRSGTDTLLASRSFSTVAADANTLHLLYDADLEVAQAYVGTSASDSNSVCTDYGVLPQAGGLSGISLGTNSGSMVAENFRYAKLGDGENGCEELLCCPLSGDDFNRSNDTDIGPSWTEVSGAWEIDGNRLEGTGSGGTPAIVLNNSPSPDIAMVVTVKATGSGSVGIIAAAEDGTDYALVQFNYTGDFVAISRVSSSTIQAISAGRYFNFSPTEYTLSVCVKIDGSVTATVDGDEVAGAYFADLTGQYAGLRVESGSTISYDDFSVVRVAGQCEECGPFPPEVVCTDCCPVAGATRRSFIVDIPAGLTDPGACSQCDIEGEYTVPNAGGSGACTWVECFSDDPFTCTGAVNCPVPIGGWHVCESEASTGCVGVFFFIFNFLDEDDECYLGCFIAIRGNSAPLTPQYAAFATYATPLGDNIDACDGQEWELELQDGSDDDRGSIGFFDAATPACGGAWPATITIRRA